MPAVAAIGSGNLDKDDAYYMYRYEYSGWLVLKNISDDDHVLDVGCGANLFKGKIKNLVGIDPANPRADVVTTIQNYRTDSKFDVALCLGSFRYGSRADIEEMIAATVNLLKPSARIYWRCRPVGTGVGDNISNIDFDVSTLFYWTEDDHRIWADKFGFELVAVKRETTDTRLPHRERIYAEWKR